MMLLMLLKCLRHTFNRNVMKTSKKLKKRMLRLSAVIIL